MCRGGFTPTHTQLITGLMSHDHGIAVWATQQNSHSPRWILTRRRWLITKFQTVHSNHTKNGTQAVELKWKGITLTSRHVFWGFFWNILSFFECFCSNKLLFSTLTRQYMMQSATAIKNSLKSEKHHWSTLAIRVDTEANELELFCLWTKSMDNSINKQCLAGFHQCKNQSV